MFLAASMEQHILVYIYPKTLVSVNLIIMVYRRFLEITS
jgi:hypothetical protein